MPRARCNCGRQNRSRRNSPTPYASSTRTARTSPSPSTAAGAFSLASAFLRGLNRHVRARPVSFGQQRSAEFANTIALLPISTFPVSPENDDSLAQRMAALGIREEDIEESFVRSGGHGTERQQDGHVRDARASANWRLGEMPDNTAAGTESCACSQALARQSRSHSKEPCRGGAKPRRKVAATKARAQSRGEGTNACG